MEAAKLYISCFDNLFAVYHRLKNTLSQRLSKEEQESLILILEKYNIPYETDISPLHDTYGYSIIDNSPCNSRVILIYENQEYNILNFNSALIKNYYAEKIAKAFQNKGFNSRVELLGSYTRAEPMLSNKVQHNTKKSVQYLQSSFFEVQYLEKLIE